MLPQVVVLKRYYNPDLLQTGAKIFSRGGFHEAHRSRKGSLEVLDKSRRLDGFVIVFGRVVLVLVEFGCSYLAVEIIFELHYRAYAGECE